MFCCFEIHISFVKPKLHNLTCFRYRWDNKIWFKKSMSLQVYQSVKQVWVCTAQPTIVQCILTQTHFHLLSYIWGIRKPLSPSSVRPLCWGHPEGQSMSPPLTSLTNHLEPAGRPPLDPLHPGTTPPPQHPLWQIGWLRVSTQSLYPNPHRTAHHPP